MRKITLAAAAALAVSLSACGGSDAPQTDEVAGYEAAIDGLTAAEGLFTLYPDPDGGRVLMALPAPDADTRIAARAIHIAYLRTGLGSNPVGLDRNSSGWPRVVRFEVRGGRVFLIAENTRFIADSDSAAERAAATESFARSVLWAEDVLETADDGRVLVDLSSFLTSDAMGVAASLANADQGAFSLDAGRSAVDPAATLAFPDNVELEAFLTFASGDPGGEVQATAAVAQAPTFTVHHSFVRLPDEGFERRAFDPRLSVIGYRVADYAADLSEPIEQPTTLRFRLERADPEAERSAAVEPIVFYVDRGAPEPVRQALIEGASWWAEAFEAAGYEDAFRVEELPEGVHPLDARYNVINWVHRQTRGWSYGAPIYDPRTGEILRAVITLGSLRVRQDRRIFEGLLDARGDGGAGGNDPIALSLARLRQLSAHEVGHGLGFAHNMAGSSADRTSVMDYPAPLVRLAPDGGLDLSDAYAEGIGAWDVATVRYLYTEFPDGTDETAALDAIVTEAYEQGLRFVTDGDARSLAGANPAGSLWDNGSDPIAALETELEVRRRALSDFGLDNVPLGAPASEIADVLTPIHLWHRYAVDAAAKAVGGYAFEYARVGDLVAPLRPVAPARQRAALAQLVRAASASELTLPDGLSAAIAPRHWSWFDRASRETLPGRMGPVFDEPAAVAIAAGLVFDATLHPARVTRLAAASPDGLTLNETLATFSDQVIEELDAGDLRRRANAYAIAERYVAEVMELASSDALAPDIAAHVEVHLQDLSAQLTATRRDDADPRRITARRITRFLARPFAPSSPREAPPPPPGSPIGNAMTHAETAWHAPLDD